MSTPHAHIQIASYMLWLKAGKPSGRDLHFWLTAERELDYGRKSSLKVWFPRSTEA